jgi:hypothetical protein
LTNTSKRRPTTTTRPVPPQDSTVPVVAASAEEEVLLFEILRLQPILNTRRYLLQFQPFLRFYCTECATVIGPLPVVSSLLEILPRRRESYASYGPTMFHPFLRFYGTIRLGESVESN